VSAGKDGNIEHGNGSVERTSRQFKQDRVDANQTRAPLAILGGGQLGRMTIQAASSLGIDIVVADKSVNSPAARLAQGEILFREDWHDPVALAELASRASTVTLESEFVDVGALRQLESLGVRVLPTPDSVEVVQDKLSQKRALAAAGIPVSPFEVVDDPDQLVSLGNELGWPLVLKARRDGYDGYGNALLRSAADAGEAVERLGWPERTLYAEARVPFERELAVIVVRGQTGEIVTYPVVETRQHPVRQICESVLAPASISQETASRAREIAREAVVSVGGIGTFGVELFLLPDERVLVNELAPRPHNSGHYSIEACVTSQFANHVRSVLGLPLGDPSMRSPAAVMVNILGTGGPLPTLADVGRSLAVPQTYCHIYGKSENRVGRKMGHVTALGSTLDEALERARAAAKEITG
jgi:5-(carboxyamino)imidazole ribonucleotide synthase